jgi:hypothetical protein
MGTNMGIHVKNFVKKCTLAFFLCAGLTNVAVAGGTQTGKVTFITIRGSDGLILIELSGTPSNKPACAPYTYWIIKNENSLVGKQQLALLVTAKATGQTVAISGTGDCTRWPNGEDIDTVQQQ